MFRVIPWFVVITMMTSSAGGSDPQRRVSPDRCLVWGPGLESNVLLPVRYFYIRAVDQHGNNFTESVGVKAFVLNLNLSDGSLYRRATTRVIDRRDGSYIANIRLLHDSVEDLTVSISFGDKYVAGTPFVIKGMVYPDHCDCPVPDLQNWFSAMKCANTYPQLEKDLSLFKSGVEFDQVAKEAIERFNGTISHYKIIDNKIYRQDYFGVRKITMGIYMDEILLSLSRKVHLPDVEFIFNLSDWPKEKRDVTENPLPIGSWCGSTDTRDITLPTYDVIKCIIYMLERHNTDIFSVQGRTGPVWGEKIETAFFRGRDSHPARLQLVELSREHPHLIDAALTNIRSSQVRDRHGPVSQRVEFFDFFKHKYQINIDGTVAAFRLHLLLASDSAVLKQDSEYYEHFYSDLEPYVHYIPVREDLSDLLDKIKWAKEHDKESEAIGRASQQYVIDNLDPAHVYCYYARFLHEFSMLLKNRPVLEKGFELVKARDQKGLTTCKCSHEKNGDKPHTEL